MVPVEGKKLGQLYLVVLTLVFTVDVSCPNCLDDAVEETCRETMDSGVKRCFECSNCGHDWDVVF